MINENPDMGEYDGLYLDGKLQEQDRSLYACDLLNVLKKMGIGVQVLSVHLPVSDMGYPDDLEAVRPWQCQDDGGPSPCSS